MIDADAREAWLDRLTACPAAVHDAIVGVPEEALCRAGPDGGWGAVEIICHLRDWDAVYLDRVERILTEHEPHIASVDDSLWPIERGYHEDDPHDALTTFAARRAALTQRLERAGGTHWQRGGRHPQLGWLSIATIVARAAEHDAEHVEQLRAALGQASALT